MTWILVQAVRRLPGVVSTITRVDRYDQEAVDIETAVDLASKSGVKWKKRLGDSWLVIAAEVDEEEASEVLADLEIGN